MKNFKKVLALVLAVLCVVPAMAFGVSAETGEVGNWTYVTTNNSSNVSADVENDLGYVTANEDGSISAWDISVATGVPVNDTALTKITSTAPNYLDGMELTIEPVGADVDGDGELEYASSYAICFTDHPELYNGTQYDRQLDYSQGHYTNPAGQDGENTWVIVIGDSFGAYDGSVPGNGYAEYITFPVISEGNYWTRAKGLLETPLDLSQPITIEVTSAFDEELQAFDLGILVNGNEYVTVADCGDAYESIAGMPVMYTSVAAYAHGQNAYTASFNLTSICNSADVAGYTGAYCAEDAHVWGEWVETAPTCTDDGVKTRACSACPKTETEVVAAATGHAYEETIVPATCDAAGTSTKVCATCGDTVVEEIAALGHNYSVKHWITLPTADAAGTARICCANCGKLQAELATIENDVSVYWKASGTASDMIANEDGSVSVVETAGVDNTTVATTNFAAPLDGFDVTINPIGADVDGDGEDEYSASYSFFYTNTPERYDGSAGYCKSCTYPYNQGLYNYGDAAAGETTMGIVLNDFMDHGWAPGYWADAVANGFAEYICFVTINEGGYWTIDHVQLYTPLDLSKEFSIEAFCYYDEEEGGALTAGALINAGTEAEEWTFATCPDAFVPLNDGCNLVIASSANGVNTHSTSFDIVSIADSTDVASFAGAGAPSVVPTIAVENDDLVVDNGALIKDIIIVEGEGYTGYADMKDAKEAGEFYYRATYAKLEGTSHKFVFDLNTFSKYTVLVRTINGEEYMQVIETGNTDPSACEPQPNDSGRIKFVFDKEVKVLRLAPVAGLRTVAEIKAADGYKAIKASNFAAIDPEWPENYSEFRYFPGSGTYSYVVEYTDGVKEFGEFTVDDSKWTGDNAPEFAANGITNMAQSKFIKAYYAPGNWNTVAEIKAAEGSKVILKAYTVRDTEIVIEETVDEMTGEVTKTETTKNLSTRHYNFKAPLSGEYTFAIVWGNKVAPATIYHVTF